MHVNDYNSQCFEFVLRIWCNEGIVPDFVMKMFRFLIFIFFI